MMTNNGQLAQQPTPYTFVLPGMDESSGEFTTEELMEDMAGLQPSFQRIKIPSGGMLQFELPSDNPEQPDYAAYIDGVILHSYPANAYWPDGEYDEEMAPPLCSSSDGVTGSGDPGGACALCPLNQWGSGENGKGKACKNMRQLYLLRSGEFMPIQLTLSPTSIKPYSEFCNIAFASRRRAAFGSVVRIGLKRKNNGKDDYSVATFQKLLDFSGEDLAYLRTYATGLKAQVKYVLSQRAQETDAAAAEEVTDLPVADLEPLQQLSPVGNGVVALQGPGAVINGDRQELPA